MAESGLVLAAPNRFIRDFVAEKYLPLIHTYLLDVVAPAATGICHRAERAANGAILGDTDCVGEAAQALSRPAEAPPRPAPAALVSPSSLVEGYTFERFVEGKSNQLALAAAQR